MIRNDTSRVRITDRTKFIWAGFRCLNSQCHSGGDDEPYPGMRPDLNSVLPAPNFLPGLELKRRMRELSSVILKKSGSLTWNELSRTSEAKMRGADHSRR